MTRTSHFDEFSPSVSAYDLHGDVQKEKRNLKYTRGREKAKFRQTGPDYVLKSFVSTSTHLTVHSCNECQAMGISIEVDFFFEVGKK